MAPPLSRRENCRGIALNLQPHSSSGRSRGERNFAPSQTMAPSSTQVSNHPNKPGKACPQVGERSRGHGRTPHPWQRGPIPEPVITGKDTRNIGDGPRIVIGQAPGTMEGHFILKGGPKQLPLWKSGSTQLGKRPENGRTAP